MQLGLTPYLRKQLRRTPFSFELGESPGTMVPSGKGWAKSQPSHRFAASTNYTGVDIAPSRNGLEASIDRTDLFIELQENPDACVEMVRAGFPICFGWTSYPRFAPSKAEVQLVNHYFPQTAALPFPTRRHAQATQDAFLSLHPELKDEIHVVSRDNKQVWFVEFKNVSLRTQGMFNELREVREYLGTGMSPREATFRGQQLGIIEADVVCDLSDDEIDALSERLGMAYRQQIAQLHRSPTHPLGEDDVFARPNATAVLVDVIEGIKSSTGKDVLNIATSGVPYSDTPITMEMIAGQEPSNTRSQVVEDVIASAEGADVIFVELGDNPKMQATDLHALNAYAIEKGIPIIVDISSVGSGNINLEKLFELEMVMGAIASSTKYSSGTVMGGIFWNNPSCRWSGQEGVKAHLDGIGKSTMFWADMAVHLRDLPTFNERLRQHSANAALAAEKISGLPGVVVNYPTKNGSAQFIDPFLREGAGYGGLLSVQFDRSLYTERQIVNIVNELDNHMVSSLSFGLPFNNALAYPGTVFPGQPESECGLDVLTLRIGLGPNHGDGLAACEALRLSITKVMGVDFLRAHESSAHVLA